MDCSQIRSDAARGTAIDARGRQRPSPCLGRTGAIVFIGALAATASLRADVILDWEVDAFGTALSAGQIIDDEFAADGVVITSQNAMDGHPDYAVIFDTDNPTGGDDDLGTPGYHPSNTTEYHNVLIVQEQGADRGDGFINADPDDEAMGGWMNFGLDFVATGLTLDLLDIEEAGGEIDFFLDGLFVDSVDIPAIADNSVQLLGFQGLFDSFQVNLAGSGAIAEIVLQQVPTPGVIGLLTVAGLARSRRRR